MQQLIKLSNKLDKILSSQESIFEHMSKATKKEYADNTIECATNLISYVETHIFPRIRESLKGSGRYVCADTMEQIMYGRLDDFNPYITPGDYETMKSLRETWHDYRESEDSIFMDEDGKEHYDPDLGIAIYKEIDKKVKAAVKAFGAQQPM